MAHRNLVATNKKLFGRTIFKSDRPLVETQQSVAPRIRQTQRQLEVLERGRALEDGIRETFAGGTFVEVFDQ